LDAPDVPAPFEGGLQPDADDLQSGLERQHPLPEGDHVGVVVLAGEARGLRVPAEGAADAAESVGGHRLAVARAAEHDAALAGAGGHGLRRWPDEERVVDRLFRARPEILDLVPLLDEEALDLLLVPVARVVGADRDLHGGRIRSRAGARRASAPP